MRRASQLLLAACAALLSACVMVPQTVAYYDAECHVVQRQMTLQAVQVASIAGCRNSGCGVLLAAAGATAAASMVISGTIAVVGNVVYWLEKQGNCMRSNDPAPPPPIGSPA